jgi:hypothetical protein
MKTAEVTVDERVSRFGLVGGASGQPKEPARIVLPRVLLEEGVLGRGLWLSVAQLLSRTYSLALMSLRA